MPFLSLSDADIFYELLGDQGPFLTLINGHTRSSRDFRLLASHLVKHGWRCLLLDNRGSGETSSRSEFTLFTIAQDIRALWEHLSIERSSLLGLSMGGMICQILAAEYPQQVEKMILVATGYARESLTEDAERPWGQTGESVMRKLEAYFTPVFLQKNRLLVDAMAKQILQNIQAHQFDEKAESQRQAMSDLDLRPIHQHIHCPTLILHGDGDRIIDISSAHTLAKTIPHAELKILEGIGHLVLAEFSRGLQAEVLQFLQA